MLSSMLLAASAIALGVSAQDLPHHYARDAGVAVDVDIRLPALYVHAELDAEVDADIHVDLNLLNIIEVKADVDIQAELQAKVDLWVGPEIDFIHGQKWYLSHTSGTPFSNLTHGGCEFKYQNPSDPKSEVDFLLALEVGVIGLDVQVSTIFGGLVAYPNYPYSWKFTGAGQLLSVTADITILGWGTDANGNAFLVIHNSAFVGLNIGASISIYSASAHGVADVTLHAIIAASIDLNVLDIKVLVNVLVSLGIQINAEIDLDLLDGCDAACRANQYTRNFPLLSIGSRKFKA
ncbi:hypothetical protein PtrSN002B_009634 [Pyrenophora tritici-repentis]|nr:hypothetical protein PtrSN002B_009634 [Pyrenophora tritici-repentis]